MDDECIVPDPTAASLYVLECALNTPRWNESSLLYRDGGLSSSPSAWLEDYLMISIVGHVTANVIPAASGRSLRAGIRRWGWDQF